MLIINTKNLCGGQTKHKHVHMFKKAFQLTIYLFLTHSLVWSFFCVKYLGFVILTQKFVLYVYVM